MLYEPEAIGVIGAYSPTRKARVYEPEAAPEGLQIGGIATLYRCAIELTICRLGNDICT